MSDRPSSFGRSVGLAVGVAALLAVVGWFVFDRFVAERPAAPSTQPPTPTPPPPPVAVPAPTDPAAPAKPDPGGAVAVSVEGSAERSKGAGWVPLAKGDRVAASESVRTSAGSRVELELGDADSHVAVVERSEVGVDEVSQAVHRLRLKRGRVQVAYQASGRRVLRIEGENGVAETRGATFVMSGTGVAVAVATEQGSVDLSAGGAHVEVAAGTQSVAVGGAAPSEAAPIPASALLKVARAVDRGELCVELKGKVRPGSEVLVDGVSMVVGPDGAFSARVPRRPNLTAVTVLTREVGGKTAEQQIPCAGAADPKAEVKVDWNAQ